MDDEKIVTLKIGDTPLGSGTVSVRDVINFGGDETPVLELNPSAAAIEALSDGSIYVVTE